MREALIQIVRFVILAAIQILAFSHFQVVGYGIPFLFLFFVLFLPPYMPRWQVILLAFLLGFTIDYFSGTYGLYAAGATFIGFLRTRMLKETVRNFEDDEDELFHFSDLSIIQFLSYMSLASFVFSIVFFLFDYFTFSAILRIGLHVIFSTASTILCIFIYRYLFASIR